VYKIYEKSEHPALGKIVRNPETGCEFYKFERYPTDAIDMFRFEIKLPEIGFLKGTLIQDRLHYSTRARRMGISWSQGGLEFNEKYGLEYEVTSLDLDWSLMTDAMILETREEVIAFYSALRVDEVKSWGERRGSEMHLSFRPKQLKERFWETFTADDKGYFNVRT